MKAKGTKDSSQSYLAKLAEHLYTAILIPMRAQGATPTVTPSPIPETSERLGPSSRGRQRQLKTECLGRDDNHCLLTPFWDPKVREIYPENQDIPANTIPTELCHIIPFAMGSYQTSHEEPNLDRTWPTLSSLFPEIKEIAHLSPESINEHRNCLALMSLFHPPFRQFKLSFEPTLMTTFTKSQPTPVFMVV